MVSAGEPRQILNRQIGRVINAMYLREPHAHFRGSNPSSAILCTTSSSTICGRRTLQSACDFVHAVPDILGQRHGVPTSLTIAPRRLVSFEHEFDDFALGHLPGLSARLLPLELEFGLQSQNLALEAVADAHGINLRPAGTAADTPMSCGRGLIGMIQLRRRRLGRGDQRRLLSCHHFRRCSQRCSSCSPPSDAVSFDHQLTVGGARETRRR